jgi:hypothetical protein
MKTYTVKESCARCPRVLEEREVTLEQMVDEDEEIEVNEVVACFTGTDDDLEFGKLCDTCRDHMKSQLATLFMPIDSPSVRRGKKAKPDPELNSTASVGGKLTAGDPPKKSISVPPAYRDS